jgi:hypothetical protein
MSGKIARRTISTRRSFLKSGTILAVPLGAVAAPAAVMADDELKARLEQLENLAAIRELHQGWLRSINTGIGRVEEAQPAGRSTANFDSGLRSVATDHSGLPDAIEVAEDGRSAVGRFHCRVETETSIAPDCTLAQMAHEQGGGLIRRTESRVVKVEYAKTSGSWSIATVQIEETP